MYSIAIRQMYNLQSDPPPGALYVVTAMLSIISLLTLFALKSVLPDVSIATAAFFQLAFL